MKILLVNKFHYMKGGSERYYFTLASALKTHGHDVIFFSMQDEKNFPCGQQRYFVSNSSVQGKLKSKVNMILHIAYSKEAYKKMKALLNGEKPDLVILNLVHKQITLSIIDAIREYDRQLPIFWTMHDLITICPAYTMVNGKGNICEECLDGDFGHCVRNKCIKGSRLMSMLSAHEAKYIRKKGWYDKIDLYICPSEFYKQKLEQAHFTKSKIVSMRNPLPLDTEYSLNDRDLGYVLYLGRLSPEKGVQTLIDAAIDANVELKILGTGPLEKKLRDNASGNKNIHFEGFKQGAELTDNIKNARCVVLPSEWYENGPYSAMEAMALGKPLIVSNYGGLPELVENGKNGYIYHTKDELTDYIKLIMHLSQEEYTGMCESSLNRAKAMFNADEYVRKIVTLANK